MGSPAQWLKTRPGLVWLRRHLNRLSRLALPDAAIPKVAQARSWLGRRRAGRWERARRHIEFMLGDSVPATRIDELANAYLLQTSWRAEVRIRPRLITHQEVVGLEHLHAALAEGKGCLVSFMHHGDYVGSFGSIARAGHEIALLLDSALFDRHRLLWQLEHRLLLESVPGSTVLDVAVGSAGVRNLLRRGGVIAIAIDFPGHTAATIFGKSLMLSSGGLRTAMELDTPVVAMTSERVRSSLRGAARTVLSAPLHPGDFQSFEELHAELVRHFEASIFLWPEAMDEPLRLGRAHLARRPTEYRPTA